ncbi:hypothetical protein J6590_059485 [Homalodisca vitripennis]|nr:hypothetical protein J6590_059485 [Homalodisca vitripennis]
MSDFHYHILLQYTVIELRSPNVSLYVRLSLPYSTTVQHRVQLTPLKSVIELRSPNVSLYVRLSLPYSTTVQYRVQLTPLKSVIELRSPNVSLYVRLSLPYSTTVQHRVQLTPLKLLIIPASVGLQVIMAGSFKQSIHWSKKRISFRSGENLETKILLTSPKAWKQGACRFGN